MIVSNTEVTSYSLCKRQHYYRFVKEVEPKYFSRALTRGLIGHEALEVYYKEMKEGSSLEVCRKGMLSVIEGHIKRIAIESSELAEFELISTLHYLSKLLTAYSEYWGAESFIIHEVEKVFSTRIDEENSYGLKLDLLVELTKGEFRGDLIVYDHKFPYNFKSQVELDSDAQLPKYNKTLKENGFYTTKGVFNQIRYREMKDPRPEDLFKRTPVKLIPVKTERIWQEQQQLAKEIALVKKSENYDPPRTLSLLVCRSCNFQSLCNTELLGEDISLKLQTEYQRNTYGYSDLVESEEF